MARQILGRRFCHTMFRGLDFWILKKEKTTNNFNKNIIDDELLKEERKKVYTYLVLYEITCRLKTIIVWDVLDMPKTIDAV